jgi:hypothetical protein
MVKKEVMVDVSGEIDSTETELAFKHTAGIKFDGVGADDGGNRYLKVAVKTTSVLMSVESLAHSQSSTSDLALLTGLGQALLIPAAKSEFIQRAQHEARKEPSFVVAPKTGFVGNTFVLPNAQYPKDSPPVERYFHPNFTQYHARFSQTGKLSAWTNGVAELCRDRPRLMTGFALSFTGPLCALQGYELPGLQFVGSGGSGRTTAVQFLATTWGGDSNVANPLPFGGSWNTTVNDLELVTAAHNQTLLVLDDMENAEKDIVKAIMKIMNGHGKGRMTERRRQTFFTPLLSNANKSVVAVLKQLGFKTGFAPYIDRLMDIPLPERSAYFFEGVKSDEEFRDTINQMRTATHTNYGVAGPLFVEKLCAFRDDRNLIALDMFCEECRERFLDAAENIPSTAGRNVGRAKNRFATIYVAGCLAIYFKILPFEEDALLDAVWSCLRDHVAFIEKELGVVANALKAATPTATAHTAYMAFQRYVSDNWESGLIHLWKPGVRLPKGHDYASAVGYVGVSNGVVEIWLPGDRFQEVAGGPREAKLLKHLLARLGLLSTWASGNQSPKLVVRRPIPGFEDKWVVAVKLPKGYAERRAA